MSGTLRTIHSQDEFDDLLTTSPKPVLVDVSATWCGPCQRLTPILEEFAASQDAVEVVTVDAGDPRALSWRLGAGTIPRMYLFDRTVLQMQVVGVRDRGWLDDVVAGYPALSIAEPAGVRLTPRTPTRTVRLPKPTAGHAGLMLVHGHDNGAEHISAPSSVDVTRDSITVLNVDTDAIECGYLRQLDPATIDQVRVSGVLTGKHIDELARLTSLQSVHGTPIDRQRPAEHAPSMGEPVDFRAQIAQQEGQLSLQDLRPLASLPLLRRVDITGGPEVKELLPNVLGDSWFAPGVAAARLERGLPDYAQPEQEHEPVGMSALLTRRPDGLLDLKIYLKITDGWYAYPPGSDEGIPVGITVTSAHTVIEPLAAESSAAAHLEGQPALRAVLGGDQEEVRVDVTVQVCDGAACLAPTTTRLVVPLTRR